jgi:YD repeat-containing protein
VTADPTQVAPGGTVAFDASASFDPDGSIKAYEFDLDGNGTYEIGPTTDPTHAIAYPAAEGKRTVPVGVRVTDSQDLQDTVVLMVPVTVAPQAQISPSSATPLSQTFVTFDAGASTDPDGTIVRYQWDLDGSGSFETDTQRSATASKAYAKPGPVTVKVLVTDDNGATAVEQTTITVANRPPVAALTAPSPVVAGRAHTFSAATSVDPDGKIKRYDWDLDLDGRYETTTGTSPTYTRTFAAGGAAAIAVQVTDEQNVVDAKRLDFQVRHAPAVDLAASANPVSLRRSTTLSAAVTDADSPLDGMTYAWDLDADGQFDDAAGPGPHPVTFATAGTRRLGVRVTDSDLATTTRTLDVVVRNAAPVARVTGPDAVQRGQSLTLDASASSDPDGAVVAYAWDLDGDGRFERQTGATPTTSTAFANAGYLQPRVQVTDDDGATQVAGVQVHVTDPPPPAPEPQPEPQPGDGGTGGTDTGGTDTGAQPPAGGSGSTPAPPADPPAPVGGTPPGGDPGTQGGPVAPARPRAVLSGAAIQRVTSVLRRGVSLTCTAVAEGRCELELFVSRTDARRLRLKKPSARTRVGRASVVLEGGKAQRVAVRLSPAVRRGLRRAGRIRLLARGFAVNGAGERVVLQRVVLVRR